MAGRRCHPEGKFVSRLARGPERIMGKLMRTRSKVNITGTRVAYGRPFAGLELYVCKWYGTGFIRISRIESGLKKRFAGAKQSSDSLSM